MIRASVIIPTYNRRQQLLRVLQALERQSVAPEQFEVVVVSDGSNDGTITTLRTLKTGLQLQALAQANAGVAAARNHGLERARADLIVFLDDDVVPATNWLATHLQAHAAGPNNRVVLGPMLIPSDVTLSPWVRWEQAMLLKQYKAIQQGQWAPTARQFYTGNTSLARQHLQAVGGFNPAFRRAEDVELAYRLAARGLRFVFAPQAIGYHYAERSFQSWSAIPSAYGRNDVIFTRQHGQNWLLPTVLYELRLRSPLIQLLARLCVGRARAVRFSSAVLRQTASLLNLLGCERGIQAAYSALFNLLYYQGLADELGGRQAFLAALARATVWVGPPQLPTLDEEHVPCG